MNFLLGMTRGIDAGTRALGVVAWWASLGMVLIGAENVVARYGYNFIYDTFGEGVARALSNNTYFELQSLLYNVVFLIGAAYVLQVDGHVRVDIIFSQLSARKRAWVDIFGTVLFLWPFALLTIHFSQRYIASSWSAQEFSPNAGGLARYPIKTLIVVAFALLMIQGLSQIIKHAAFLRGHPASGSLYANEKAQASAPPPGAAPAAPAASEAA